MPLRQRSARYAQVGVWRNRGSAWTRPDGAKLFRCLLVAAIFAAASAQAAFTPVVLYLGDNVASVWDTDPPKIGVELQVGNSGSGAAEDVRVTSVTVQQGVLYEPAALPILLGTIRPQSRALLDVVIILSPNKTTRPLLTIGGSYVHDGIMFGFSLSRTISM